MIKMLKAFDLRRHLLTFAFLLYSSTSTFHVSAAPALPTGQSSSLSVDVSLRILPLGDSITWGTQSTDGNGYRQDLLNLIPSGNKVEYIGTQKGGSMVENSNEGHPGAVIDEIAQYAVSDFPARPNLVLLMAGTNDCGKQDDVAGAPGRLGKLIDEIVSACPDATVIVAQIPPQKDAAAQRNVVAFNAAIPDVVKARASTGKHVLTVDMSQCLTLADLDGGLHPSDEGYAKMAQCWYGGIKQASSNKWLKNPVQGAATSGSQGKCTSGIFWDPSHGTIASGIGSPDAPFKAVWSPAGNVFVGQPGQGVHFGDMFGSGTDDYLWADPKTGGLTMYRNSGYRGYNGGSLSWDPWGPIADGLGDGAGVILADLDGDGRSDYLWVSPSGQVTAYRNVGNGAANANAWHWAPIDAGLDNLGEGTRDSIRFADIDGDGRADYLVVGPGGNVAAWLNTGPGPAFAWESLGEIASGTGSTDRDGVRMVDLNGDGKADYVWLDKNGAATAYINGRGHVKGPNFSPASQNPITAGVGTSRDNIVFADLNGDGKYDYIWVNTDNGDISMWTNQCSGGTAEIGDGTMLVDMDGDGLADYVAMNPQGGIELYLNHGWDIAAKTQIWSPQGNIAGGLAQRQDVRLADMDGDGKADYVIVDAKTGSLTVWKNGGPKTDGWIWYPPPNGPIASGLGAGRGVVLADLNGDKKADYLWVDTNGAVTAYMNGGPKTGGWNWAPYGNIASGVGAARADVRFADLNGDGLADYISVDRLSGSVYAWYGGLGTPNKWVWYPQPQIAAGVGANGLSILFADMTGDGRADYVNVDPVSGSLDLWLNGCGTPPSSPSSALTLTQNQKNPPAWQIATCSDAGVTNAAMDQTTRWNDEDTDSAWAAAVQDWTNNGLPGGLTFSESISNFFHGPEQLTCGMTDDHNGCDSPILCIQPPAGYVGGYFIINSFVAVNNLNLNFYDAISRAESQIEAVIGTFSTQFSPIVDQNAFLKVILDFLALGFALAAAPVWNAVLKKAAYFAKNGNTLGTLKDSVNPLVSQGVTTIKDGDLGQATISAQNTLEQNLGNMITAYYNSIGTLNAYLFSGQQSAISQLQQMITGGKMLEAGQGLDDPSIQTIIEHAMFGMLIPQAWSLGNKGVTPFIMNSNKPCSAKNPFPKYMSNQVGEETYVCVDNTLYYLLSATGKSHDCIIGIGAESCTNNEFSTPPGLTSLDGKAYGGVTKDELVNGALAGFNLNGQKNGWPTADPGDGDTLSALYDTGIQTPGVVNIPVCTVDVAWTNWENADNVANLPFFPCNAIPPKR